MPIVWSAARVSVGSVLNSVKWTWVVWDDDQWGHCDGLLSHCGPCAHQQLLCSHTSGEEVSWILIWLYIGPGSSRLKSKYFLDAMNNKLVKYLFTWLSDQNLIDSILYIQERESQINLANCIATTVAINSNFGNVIGFTGATRDLAIVQQMCGPMCRYVYMPLLHRLSGWHHRKFRDVVWILKLEMNGMLGA